MERATANVSAWPVRVLGNTSLRARERAPAFDLSAASRPPKQHHGFDALIRRGGLDTGDFNGAMTRIWSFGGGKGGVGKSLVCAAVATELAQRGQRVVVLDADLGSANLHTLLGLLYPEATLADFFGDRTARLSEVCLPTPIDGLSLISGAAAILGAAHPAPAQRARLIREICELDAHVVVVDLGSGTHYDTLDFFNLAEEGLVVTGPEPTAIQNAYAFMKAARFRWMQCAFAEEPTIGTLIDRALLPRGAQRIESVERLVAAIDREEGGLGERARECLGSFRARLIVNQASSRRAFRISTALASVCSRHLGLDLPLLAALPADREVAHSVQRMESVVATNRGCAFSKMTGKLVDQLLQTPRPPRLDHQVEWLLRADPMVPSTAPPSMPSGHSTQSIATTGRATPTLRASIDDRSPAGHRRAPANNLGVSPRASSSARSSPQPIPAIAGLPAGLAQALAREVTDRSPSTESDPGASGIESLDPALDPWRESPGGATEVENDRRLETQTPRPVARASITGPTEPP